MEDINGNTALLLSYMLSEDRVPADHDGFSRIL